MFARQIRKTQTCHLHNRHRHYLDLHKLLMTSRWWDIATKEPLFPLNLVNSTIFTLNKDLLFKRELKLVPLSNLHWTVRRLDC